MNKVNSFMSIIKNIFFIIGIILFTFSNIMILTIFIVGLFTGYLYDLTNADIRTEGLLYGIKGGFMGALLINICDGSILILLTSIFCGLGVIIHNRILQKENK
jgi:hypothetical protein